MDSVSKLETRNPKSGNYCSVLITTYISLGSNLGDRAGNLRAAIKHLKMLGVVTAVSSFYETEPVEFIAQPWFVNCVIEMKTDLGPRELLDALLNIEQTMGRIRGTDKGPRNIDLDILLYGDQLRDEPGLTIPHPVMHERRFVLEPLAEIAPRTAHPVLKKNSQEMLDALPQVHTVRQLKEQ